MDVITTGRPREFALLGPGDSVPPQHPAELVSFAHGFARSGRDEARFLWRSTDAWHAVRMQRREGPANRADTLVTYAPVTLPFKVTEREVDILTLVALGLTNGQIAERLGTSPRTVSTQVERLLSKCDQRTRGGLAALVVDAAMIRLPIPGGTDDVPSIAPVEVERGLGLSLNTRQPTNSRRLRRRPFLLGTVVPSMGPVTPDGVESERGSTLAVEQVNQRGGIGGRPIEHLVVEVDMTNAEAVRQSFESLFDQEVDAITTSYVNAENPFVLDMVADFGRPFLHLATYEDQVELVRQDPVRYGMVFQTCPSETHYGSGLVRFLDQLVAQQLWQPRARRIVTIEVDAMSTRTTNETFVKSADQSGWRIHDVIRVPIGLNDWSAVVSRVAAADPDVVMITHFVAGDVVALQSALHAAKLDALVYHVYGASIPEFADRLGSLADGVVWSSVTGLYDDTLGDQFRQQYQRRFGVAPGWAQASAAYDQVGLLSSAWAATDSHSPSEVVRYMRQSAYRGLNGVYFLGAPGQASRGYPDEVADPSLGQAQMVYQYQGGRSRVLSPATHGRIDHFRLPA